ncbi:hypothetical protein ElyMa_001399300 [Elysia marginata]|uniref:Uncharacterized protein n=1 Tax=Elysia marginata TaxID=1093978 RepID=A0AAV4IVU9_9GAST|nr:hypothetical protein ElyMa_001399300 [Elysia marginata]
MSDSDNKNPAKEPVHTYKDDIIYQTVKGNHKRSPFVSCDHQIVNMGAGIIRNIEKNEKLVTSDLRRSQAVLMAKLERLHKVQDSINAGGDSDLDGRVSQRRFSVPLADLHRIPSPTRKAVKSYYKRGSSGSEDDVDGVDLPRRLSNASSPRREITMIGESSPGTATPDMKEARRLSFVAQEETSKKALQKLDALVAEHKRRATIASGATGLLPSASDLARLKEIAKRSFSIEEEHQ